MLSVEYESAQLQSRLMMNSLLSIYKITLSLPNSFKRVVKKLSGFG